MAIKNERFADAGAAAMEAIAKIQADADEKMREQLERLKDAITEKRAAIRAIENEIDALVAVKEQITGRTETKPANAVATRGKRPRMSAGEFETYKETIIELLTGRKEGVALSEMVAACGPKAPGVINKLKALKILKSNGIKGSSGRTMLA
jgi:hypothetical protein